MSIQIEKGALKSHVAHAQHVADLENEKSEKEKRLFSIKQKDSVAYALNIRTIEILKPFFFKNYTWLTIGDYNGFEANYLRGYNQIATASDLSDVFLKEVKAENLIDDYRIENVEQLSLSR
jgi:hypothetical protein